MEVSPRPGAGAGAESSSLPLPVTKTLHCPGTRRGGCRSNAGPRHEEVVLTLLGGFVRVPCKRQRRKIELTVIRGLKQPLCSPFSSG